MYSFLIYNVYCSQVLILSLALTGALWWVFASSAKTLHCILSPQLINGCIFSKGGVLTVACTISLTVLMNLSIPGTCSLHPVIFSICHFHFLLHLICPSPSTCHIFKPLPWYELTICFRDVIVFVAFFILIISAVTKWKVSDVINMNGILLMYIMYTASVKFPCCSRGNGWGFPYCFAFSDPKFGS